MIDPIDIRIKFADMDLFKEIENISYDEDGIIIKQKDDRWNVEANGKKEVWVKTLDDRIRIRRSGVKEPIFILTADPKLLPYCMKDRLAYLQDRTNKENEHNE